MIVVSDTSPITNLAAVGYLDLLRALYDTIVIPQAVYQEMTRGGISIPGALEVQTLNWIETRQVANQSLVSLLQIQSKLDLGESEAIALAVELQADWLLIDEELRRTAAKDYGLRLVGVLGILIEAKTQGLIPQVKPILDDLIVKAEFWVSQSLYLRVLQVAGEKA